jgi:hypothetical protein
MIIMVVMNMMNINVFFIKNVGYKKTSTARKSACRLNFVLLEKNETILTVHRQCED